MLRLLDVGSMAHVKRLSRGNSSYAQSLSRWWPHGRGASCLILATVSRHLYLVIGVNITAFGREITRFKSHPTLQLFS